MACCCLLLPSKRLNASTFLDYWCRLLLSVSWFRAAICTRLYVCRLTTVQRESFHELLALVEVWEDEHDESASVLKSQGAAAAAQVSS